jgi:hypothetical protein
MNLNFYFPPNVVHRQTLGVETILPGSECYLTLGNLRALFYFARVLTQLVYSDLL